MTMKFIRDETGMVGKYIHGDGSETSIKHVSSCDTIVDPHTGVVHANNTSRNKYSVFVSSSHGCFMSCKFCHLTLKGMSYKKLPNWRNDVVEAVSEEFDMFPDMKDKFVKLCWMGMGEDHMIDPVRTVGETYWVVDEIIMRGMAKGIDGCDISTVLPKKVSEDFFKVASRLEVELENFKRNPVRSSVHGANDYRRNEKSLVRLFYSLHSASQPLRDHLIPNAMSIEGAFGFLKEFAKTGLNVVFHHLFLDGLNDTEKDVFDIIDLLTKHGLQESEFRILRYNAVVDRGEKSIRESVSIGELSNIFMRYLPNVKLQISTGKDINSACGQFYAGEKVFV